MNVKEVIELEFSAMVRGKRVTLRKIVPMKEAQLSRGQLLAAVAARESERFWTSLVLLGALDEEVA